MSVAFFRGQQLGREDLNLFLENNSSVPVNAAEIAYALYDFTTAQEVLVGLPRRVPANPSVGEYYASIIVPLDANLGNYRIRWTFRESVAAPMRQVVQEFEVVDKVTSGTLYQTAFTLNEASLIRSLRILLRDNCVGGEETVELDADGERLLVRMDELWGMLHDISPP